MSFVARARQLQCRRNDYGRGREAGQRGGCARSRALRGEKTAQGRGPRRRESNSCARWHGRGTRQWRVNGGDEQHAPGVTVRTLMDVALGHAQPEGFERFRR
jgi:hypothetical protein